MGITNIVIIVIDSGSYLKPFSRYPMNHVPHSYPSPRAIHFPCISAPMAKRSRSINIPKFTPWNMAETWYIIWYIIWLPSIPYWESLQCCLCISIYIYINIYIYYITIGGFIMSIPRTGYIIQLHPIVGSISHEFSLYYPIKSAFNGCRIHLYSLTMAHQLYPPSMYRYSSHRPWIPHELPVVK